MKILFVSATLPPDPSATGIVLANLIPELQKIGVVVEGLTFKQSLYDEDIEEGLFRIHYINYTRWKPKDIRKPKNFIFYLIKKIVLKLFKNISEEKISSYMMFKGLQRIKNIKYDYIIGVSALLCSIIALSKFKSKHPEIKMVYYQLDPLSDNFALKEYDNQKLKDLEKLFYNQSSFVLTMPQIYKFKDSTWNLNNVIPIELPGIIKPKVDAINNDNREIIYCVFTGYLYGALRDATFALKLFSAFKDKRIHLYIIGSGQETLLKHYSGSTLKGNLHLIGSLPSKECNTWIEKADVLVNIGNSVKNALPSKVFTYISFGKPILNLCDIEDCPSLQYFNKLSNVKSVIKTDDLCSEYINDIENFLISSKNNRISFETVEKKFEDCTPKFVANEFYKNLKKHLINP